MNESASGDGSKTDTVLIVDDSLTVRMDLSEAFQAAGFHSLPCATVAEARLALGREPIQVVILDVILPDGDGVDLLREIRGLPFGADLAILMLSSEAEIKDRIRGLNTGADEYVGKPYDVGYVVARARELLRDHHVTPNGATTVLVIDDSATYREALRTTFESAGYTVMSASSGEEGLRTAALRRPGIIVVDGVLPGIDGATVIRRVRLDAALRDVPCVLLTGSESPAAELRALDAGADAFVRKEEDAGIILAKLSAVIRRATSGSALHATASALGPKKILAVDDSLTYLQEIASSLRGEGYDVILARSGEEAIELLAIQSVDCILLDLMMPGMGGQETCQRVKAAQMTRDVPLVMLTAMDEREAMLLGLGAGADDYVSKSSDLEVLKARVRAQIRRKQFEDENRRIREELLRSEIEATEARAARALADVRAAMVAELEERVAERTADLARANQELTQEIDERRRAESALARAEEQFRQSQKMEAVGRLAGGVAHDFNNLLAVIVSTAELCRADLPVDSQMHKEMDQIVEAGMRAADLTKQLLAFSRKQVMQTKILDLNAVIRNMDRLLRRLISAEIEIATTPGTDLGSVMADPGQIEQVILNLVVNSRDAMPKGGKITIETGNANFDEDYVREHGGGIVGPQVMLAVSDTGHGMNAETRARIFEPFFTTKELGKGTGLGLSTVYGIVQQSGGNVWVYSEPGRGTTFKVYLPRVDEPPDLAALPASAIGVGGNETILVVEDDVMVRGIVRKILTRSGYQVLEAGDPRAALSLCREMTSPIDLLLSDVILPKVSGRELADQLVGVHNEMKVLFMSGYADNAIVHNGMLDPGISFIAKPFTPTTLARKVREVLDS
jgi:DNA-binding response OmpR family regulator